MNYNFLAIFLLVLLLKSQLLFAAEECLSLPPHKTDLRSTWHGHSTWRSSKAILFHPVPGASYHIHEGFYPVAYEKKEKDGCVTFPPKQVAVFLSKEHFVQENISLAGMDTINTTLHSLKGMPSQQVDSLKEDIKEGFLVASRLFPLGMNPEPNRFDIFISIGVAGPATGPNTRLAPGHSSRLLTLFRSDQRNFELIVHNAVHLYNRYRALLGNNAHSKAFPKRELQEFIASWADLYYQPDIKRRTEQLTTFYKTHLKFFEELKSLPSKKFQPDGEDGIVPLTRIANHYAHYTLAPLWMTAAQNMLARTQGAPSMEAFLAAFFSKKDTQKEFLKELSEHLPEEDIAQLKTWLTGKKRIPWFLLRP